MSSDYTKAKFVVEETKKEIYVQFNPEEYSVSESSRYSGGKKRGKQSNKLQFAGEDARTIRLSFFFDTYTVASMLEKRTDDDIDVSLRTNEIASLAKRGKDETNPAIVTFTWGNFEFKGVITRATTTYTMFDNKGIPIRAKMEVEMQEDNSTKSAETTKKAPTVTTSANSQASNIWELADKLLNDINQWKELAKANKVMDPLDVEIGTVFQIPE